MQSKIKRLELLMKSKSYTSTKHTKYIRAENIAFKGMRNPTNKYLIGISSAKFERFYRAEKITIESKHWTQLRNTRKRVK